VGTDLPTYGFKNAGMFAGGGPHSGPGGSVGGVWDGKAAFSTEETGSSIDQD